MTSSASASSVRRVSRRSPPWASGATDEAAVTGVFDLTKIGSQAWTVGAKVYWDDTNKRCTTVATDNTLIGVAVEAVAGGAGDTIGRVRLNGTF
jgi:predicted RecA/RadA family phage recombinase